MGILKKALVVALLVAAGLAAFSYVQPQVAMKWSVDAERRMSGLERKTVTLRDGLCVYLEGGKGEPLVLLHGFGADKDNFTRVARFLTPHYHVIVPDAIGFGESAHPDADYSPIAQAERVRELVKALGLGRVHLGGSSMGGHVAITYAALHKDEVQSLWLLDTSGVWSAPQSELTTIIKKTGHNPLISRSNAEFAEAAKLVMSDPPFIPGPFMDVMAQQNIPYASMREKIFKQVTTDSVEKRARTVSVPALIVWGKEDRALHPATAEVLHKLLENSKVVMMPGVGHLPMLERPEQSAKDYLGFRQSP